MSQNLKADLLLAFCTLIWGATFVIVKERPRRCLRLHVSGLAIFLAAAVLAVIYPEIPRLRARKFRAQKFSALKWNDSPLAGGALMGFLLFAGYTLQTAGIQFTTPSKAAFITGFSVVLVPVLLALFAHCALTNGILGGAPPRLRVCTAGRSRSGPFARLNRGDLLVLGGAVMFALHIISVGPLYADAIPAGALTSVQVAMMAALTLIAVPLFAIAGWQRPRV